MMLLKLIACLFLVGCSAAPQGGQEIVLTKDLFNDAYVLYSGNHDIVRIFVPLNQFNQERKPYTVFFVEGDYKNDEVMKQGLYVFNRGNVTKLLDNGRDAIETKTNAIYFGAEDGIYKYDSAAKTATKHGTVTDSVSQLAYNNKTNSIYYLTDDNEVYKLNEDATASVKVSSLTDVQELVFDFDGNLYYYNSKKEFYIIVDFEASDVPKKITGLPTYMNEVVLLTPIRGSSQGVLLYADKVLYVLESNQNIEKVPERIEVSLTAVAPQPVLVHFYAKDKKLYAFSFRAFMLSGAIQPKQETTN